MAMMWGPGFEAEVAYRREGLARSARAYRLGRRVRSGRGQGARGAAAARQACPTPARPARAR